MIRQSIFHSRSSRRVNYKLLNPDFVIDEVYCKKRYLKEMYIIPYSQFKVSGHILVIETGQSNRRSSDRLSVQERLCQCGSVQTKLHALEFYPLTANVRDTYSFMSWSQLM